MPFPTCQLYIRTLEISRLLNPDWSIQISRAPAICKAVFRICFPMAMVLDRPLNMPCKLTNQRSCPDSEHVNIFSMEFWKVAWPSELGRCMDLKFGGPWFKSCLIPPYCYLDLLRVVPSSTPPLRYVNNQLVRSHQFLNSLCLGYLQYLVIYLQCLQLVQQY